MKKLLPVLIIFFALNGFSQKEANFWYFGEGAGLDFSTNPPKALTDGQLNTEEGCSSFSSPSGELLFYSDGIKVFNKDHELMTYSDGRLANNLRGNPSSTQSGMIIPKPSSTSIYYLFTVGTDFVGDAGGENPGFNYYTIDFSSNPLGEITNGPVNLAINPNTNADLSNVWSEKVAAVKGAGCDEVWVISFVESTFYAYKVDPSGVDVSGVVTSQVNFSTNDKRGYLQVSPNGEKIAFADYRATRRGIDGSLVLFDFDSATGIINRNSSQVLIPRFSELSPYGVAFSQQSNKLYASTYDGNFKVFQFDLESSNISSSRNQIINKNGFRGALQLGPDGKIYASIPDSNFLDIIENPNDSGDDIIYTQNAIDLQSGITSQGLPPFLSSLLLPIEIKDSDTNEILNNEDLQYCLGENKTIIPEIVTGTTTPTYEWFFNKGTSTVSIADTSSLTLNNLSFADSGTYSLVVNLTDKCGNIKEFNATFNIEVFEAAVATKPTDIIFCDTDKNGFNDFDLQAEKNDEILNDLDSATFEVRYFFSLADATENVNPLPNLYTNPSAFSSQTIHARVQNRNAVDACPVITEFILAVTDLPIPTQPTPLRICDDLASGDDTDGIVDSFILSNKDNEIYGSLNTTQYTISYHTTQAGAEINDATTVIDKNENHTVTNTQTVYIRVENKDNTDCYDAEKTLELIVDALPVITAEVTLLQCDDDLDRISTINLTEAEISISTNYKNEIFAYFETEAQAIAGTPEVDDKLRYPVNQTGQAWVRTISSESPEKCFRISKINLQVDAAADVEYNKEFPTVCDDFLQTDGTNGTANDDTDGITNFDFSDADAEILVDFPPALQSDLEISYYQTRDDRIAVINSIADISNYRNIGYPSNVTRQTIYFKITNKNNNNCNGTGELYLKTGRVPTANTVADLELCDNGNDGDGTNGIVQSFNLESQTLPILGAQNSNDFTVTYHLTAAEANSGNNSLPATFENTIPDSQLIYVRVTNNTTACFTAQTSFNLIVNIIPIANFVEDLEICDDNSDGSARNGFSQNIDLESQTAGILKTQDPAVNRVTYHNSFADTQTGNNPLSSPYSNSTPNRETIFIRVYNSETACANGISNFDVIVNPEPTFNPPTSLSYCDDNLDGDDANGIVQNIDLNSKIPEILGVAQNPNDFNITFHALKAGATEGTGAIDSPYQNTNPMETIYVRIQNKRTSCVNDDATFDIIINSLPDFTVTTPQIICLLDAPLNIAIENPRDIYSYKWKDENGTILNTISRDNINVTAGGRYKVRATTTNGTFCEREETIVIEESNPAILENSFVTIIDDGNNISSNPDLSISIDTISNNLGIGDYQFAIINTENNERFPFIGFQNEPLFESLEGGIYQIIVNDKNGCVPDTTLLVSVIQFPKFFTPNGDGENDFWVIKGADKSFYPNASINVFNRFGKLIAQIPIDAEGWDGVYQGKVLPSDDYWYNITLIPADNTKPTITKKGNFSLLRK